MSHNKYQISDIRIGDEVYFDSTDEQHNHNEYWIVKDIYPGKNEIYIHTPDAVPGKEYITIHVSEIRARLPVFKKKMDLPHSFGATAIAKRAS